MSQISPPVRILALCALGFLAVWMFFLRPGSPATQPAPPASAGVPRVVAGGAAAGTSLGKAVEKANEVAGQADAAAAKLDGAVRSAAGRVKDASSPSAASLSPAAARSARALPARLRRAVRAHKVIVLAVLDRRAADDRGVRRELRQVRLHRRQAVFATTNLRGLGRYQQITRGADVRQSPTVVVVDARLRAEALVGYSDRADIEQAIDDAYRAAKH